MKQGNFENQKLMVNYSHDIKCNPVKRLIHFLTYLFLSVIQENFVIIKDQMHPKTSLPLDHFFCCFP